MNPVERPQTGIQPWAILILCRCVLFFCGKTPLTAVYALGTLLSIAAVGILLVPLLLCTRKLLLPCHLLYRFAGIYTAALLLSELYDLLSAQQTPNPSAVFVLMLLAVCYGLILPRRTTGRAAVLLMLLTAAAMLVLLCSSISHGDPLLLYTPAPHTLAQCFWQAMEQNLPLVFLPLCMGSYPTALRRTWLLRILGSLPVFALLIAAGAWCCGRLTQWEGSPFLLLIAQTQGNSAIRTDGFWAVLIPAAGVTAIVFCLQVAIGRTPEYLPSFGETLLPVGITAAIAILFIMENHPLWVSFVRLILCLGLLPLWARLHPQKEVRNES